MKRTQYLLAALGLGAMTFAATSVSADLAPERKSTLTVIDRVEVPGAILEPGTYVVKLVDVKNNRNIVHITNVDETKIFAAAIATPHEALQSTPNTAFTYYSSPAGTPRILRTWFGPNEKIGQDFVYSPQRAAELAKLTKEKIPELTADMSRDLDRNREPKQPTEVVLSPAPEAAPAPAQMAETHTAPEAGPAAPDTMIADNSDHQLPKTASHYPMLLAIGLVAILAASALRLFGRSA
jgi:hypothetical protein